MAATTDAAPPVVFGPRNPDEESSDESDHDCALFMKTLPEDPDAHPTLAALSSLQDEEISPEASAEFYKGEGNQLFQTAVKCPHEDRKRQLLDAAVENYTLALAARSPDAKAVSVYYSNRATANFSLENYGKAISDCRWALKHDSHNVKAAYRAAMAAKSLGKHELVIKYAQLALELPALDDKQRAALQAMVKASDNALAQQRQQDATAAARQERQRKAVMRHLMKKQAALQQRGIKLGPLRWNGGDATLRARLADTPTLSAEGTLAWPVLFLYDEHGQSDFIEVFDEHDTFAPHLAEMFPAPGCVAWDHHGVYVHDNLELFVETSDDTVLHKTYEKFSPDCSLLQVLQRFHHQLPVPGLPVIYVLPKGSTHQLPD